MEQIYRHPEWKRLYDELAGEMMYGQVLTYERIKEISGIDMKNPIQSVANRARSQFRRCAKEMLKLRMIHFEPVPRCGYRAVQPNEHLLCGSNRVKRGWRRFKDAERIVEHTDLTRLSDKERTASIEVQVHLRLLLEHTKERDRAISTGRLPPRLPSPQLDRYRSRVEESSSPPATD